MGASNGFKFDRLGVRVPTVVISPWIRKGRVVNEAFPGEKPSLYSAFESTSIMATTNILLGLSDARPLGKRMSWANTFAGLFEELEEPRTDCPILLPDVPKDPNPEESFIA